jgi:CMP-N-acetylneuraminic acid synthetase
MDNLPSFCSSDSYFDLLMENHNLLLNVKHIQKCIRWFEGNASRKTMEAHQFEDTLYKKFIEQISTGKLTNSEEIREIAKGLNVIREMKHDRWYA